MKFDFCGHSFSANFARRVFIGLWNADTASANRWQAGVEKAISSLSLLLAGIMSTIPAVHLYALSRSPFDTATHPATKSQTMSGHSSDLSNTSRRSIRPAQKQSAAYSQASQTATPRPQPDLWCLSRQSMRTGTTSKPRQNNTDDSTRYTRSDVLGGNFISGRTLFSSIMPARYVAAYQSAPFPYP